MSIEDINSRLIELRGELRVVKESAIQSRASHEDLKGRLDKLQTARGVLQTAANRTQEKLETDLTDLVSAALSAISLKQDYKFAVKFEARRNSTECDLLFKKGIHFLKPLTNCGYGAADIASLALRIAFWKLRGDLRNTMIVDEPITNLDKTKQHYFVDILRTLSREIGIQFIISTHETAYIEAADAIFEVSMENEASKVTRIK